MAKKQRLSSGKTPVMVKKTAAAKKKTSVEKKKPTASARKTTAPKQTTVQQPVGSVIEHQIDLLPTAMVAEMMEEWQAVADLVADTVRQVVTGAHGDDIVNVDCPK